MKELDLQNATLLKKFLSVAYHDYQIKGEKDICTLTRMCLKAVVGYLFWTVVILLGIFLSIFVLSSLSLVTLFFPEGYQAPSDLLDLGATSLAVITFLSVIFFAATLSMYQEGGIDFAPEYMKRPLRKLFKKKVSLQDDTPPKEKVPSQTWIAIKEMYKSVKEKTCIKVKL